MFIPMPDAILAALARGAINLGILALAAILFGAWFLASPFAFKLGLVACGIAYLAQTFMTLEELAIREDAALERTRPATMRWLGAGLWLACLVVSAAAILVLLAA